MGAPRPCASNWRGRSRASRSNWGSMRWTMNDARSNLAPTLATLLEDQRARWERGERPAAEDYLVRHPALGAEDEAALDLIANEALLRQERGEAPELGEYQRRFPRLAAQLAAQFEVER